MELLTAFIDIVLHLDAHLLALTQQYGMWVYAILFLIIYCETGLVVTPFLPGDSLLFVAGIGLMRYRLFMLFSALGSLAWIGSLTVAGYFFGNIPIIKNNLTLMILGIIVISFLPAIREFIRHRKQAA